VSEASEMRFLMASILELQADEADHPCAVWLSIKLEPPASSWPPRIPFCCRKVRLSVTSTGTTSSPFKVETVQPTIVMNFMIKR
jgi:hypothetical protein